ncbi:MAG: hypothetical protein SFX73_24040 [Kofleriaceae bacterium]|nr:hypothetical protein [Kofleriaceae bacterium]
MSWMSLVALGAAGLASMKAAMERGDVDEASRQGVLAGPAVVEAALASPDRATRLAGIAAATAVDDRVELLDVLGYVAAGPDPRSAIPAARAARTIARDFARTELPDDLAPADVAAWRDRWTALALARDRWVEVRVLSVEIALALDPANLPFAAILDEPDPAVRRAAVTSVPMPVPAALRPALAATVTNDADPQVALGAAQALCADLVADPARPVLDALGPQGLARLRALAAMPGLARAMKRDLARCLK